jgi:hypothetical protein
MQWIKLKLQRFLGMNDNFFYVHKQLCIMNSQISELERKVTALENDINNYILKENKNA